MVKKTTKASIQWLKDEEILEPNMQEAQRGEKFKPIKRLAKKKDFVQKKKIDPLWKKEEMRLTKSKKHLYQRP